MSRGPEYFDRIDANLRGEEDAYWVDPTRPEILHTPTAAEDAAANDAARGYFETAGTVMGWREWLALIGMIIVFGAIGPLGGLAPIVRIVLDLIGQLH